jgi:simple sugar transport system permease protein
LGGIALVGLLALTLIVFGLPLGESIRLIFEGAFQDRVGLSRTAVLATPLLLTALGVVVSWKAGMFNIGGEGQYVMGGLSGAALAKLLLTTPIPGPLGAVLILAAAATGGALWARLAAWMFVRRGVDVVISTILLNFVAASLLAYLVSGPLQEDKRQLPLTEMLPRDWMLPRFDRQLDFHLGVALALLAAPAVWLFLYQTVPGYLVRLVGAGATAARANRISSAKYQSLALSLGGGLCGLAAGVQYLGIVGQIGQGFSQQWGFLGIPVALLGGMNPFGVALSAVFFGGLFAGSENLARFTPAGTTIVYVLQAVAVLAYIAVQALQEMRRPEPA